MANFMLQYLLSYKIQIKRIKCHSRILFPFLRKEVVHVLVRFQLLRLKTYKSLLGEEKG